MRQFDKVLYEATLVAFEKNLAPVQRFARGSILFNVGRKTVAYRKKRGHKYE